MLINCVAYQNGRKLADIARSEISEYVKRPDCFVWVALYEPDRGELEEMQEEFGLHELAVDDAQTGHQRPKIEEYGNSLFVVLHTVELEGKSLRVGEVDIFAGGLARRNIEALYALKQKLMVLRHASGPLVEGVGKLYGGRVPQVCVGTQEYFRDVYDHLGRINQTIDGIRDSVTTAMAVSVSLIQLQENEMMKRLAGYASLVAIPTMIAGLYGMNFKHMPELDWTFGYPMAVGAMVAIDSYLFYRFRKAGWL